VHTLLYYVDAPSQSVVAGWDPNNLYNISLRDNLFLNLDIG